MRLNLHVTSVFGLVAQGRAAAYQDAAVASCCSMLATRMPNPTFPRDTSDSSVNRTESTAFWSGLQWLSPTCVFLPSNTPEVSQAIEILKTHGYPFSVRGGGHSAIRVASNIDDGILVSLRRVRDISLSDDGLTATVGAGNTWAQVYKTLEPQGRMVVGGRFGNVGLGLALGAGFTYFTKERGLAVDNTASHRVVLADGNVVDTSVEGEYADLHWELRGGNSNFGVVTRFVFETVPTDGMFGGRVTYAPGTLGKLKSTRSRPPEFCSGLSHSEGLAGLHTLIPILPQAIEKAGEKKNSGFESC